MKLLYTILLACCCGHAFAQTWVADSVTMQAGYANEIYYSLANDEQATVEIRNWDLAFATNLFEVTVLANPMNGVTVYKTPYTLADYALFDTSGYSAWPTLYNDYNDWSAGTLLNARDTAQTLDYGWGNYNPTTHLVNGTRVFLLKIEQNSSVTFKKFYVNEKDINGNWEFRVADVDGANDVTKNLDVSTYQDKHFVYYSIGDDLFLDREPSKTSWDLLFTRYYAPVGPNMFYPVTGVLTNTDTQVATAEMVDVNAVQETDYTAFYTDTISAIGYDWKTFNGLSYDVQDSLVYFVKTQNGDVFKLRFTAFESTDGKIVFAKSEVLTSVTSLNQGMDALAIFPNPSSSNINLVVNAQSTVDADFIVYDALGQALVTQHAVVNGLSKITLPIQRLPNGVYIVSVESNHRKLTEQRFVKQ